MIIYTENTMELTKKLLELIRKFRNIAEYDTNIQKPIVFLYTSSK